MSRRLWALTALATALAIGHHLDHVIRGDTGWPLAGELNPFTFSLLIYPAIATGVVLTLAGLVGARFWAALAGGGALFVLAVHVGPGGDSITRIPSAHASPALGIAAVAELGALIGVLVLTAVHDLRSSPG